MSVIVKRKIECLKVEFLLFNKTCSSNRPKQKIRDQHQITLNQFHHYFDRTLDICSDTATKNVPVSKESIASLSVLSPWSIAASSANSCSKAHSSATLTLAASVSRALPAAALSSHLKIFDQSILDV